MTRHATTLGLSLSLLLSAGIARAQDFPTDDPVIQRLWAEGMDRSQVYSLSQTLLDSLGPRLTGTPESDAAADWVIRMYRSWGIEAYNEPYGTWDGWRRGTTHVDLVRPRVRTLEATMLAWSPGTDGPVEGEVLALPRATSPADFPEFLGRVAGKFVLMNPAEVTCRPDDNWAEFGTDESITRLETWRDDVDADWARRIEASGLRPAELVTALEEAGAAGILTSRWSNGWGVQKIFSAGTERVPTLDLSCEDYGLVFRLAENGQGPVLRVDARAESLGEVEVANTIGVIRGSELPDEYVLLSAHFDSWDGGSGATDNGTGTITMMEAMRILATVHPRPRRTILVGHWNGEEQGLNGSRAFAFDHPEIVEGMQALFNQDNGTGRVSRLSMQGLTEVAPYFAEWFSAIPRDLTQHVTMEIPGTPGGGGSDYASFIWAGAPAFSLSSISWDYGTYTWHTNRDTFDKVVMDDLRNNAVLTAMLVYLAAEEADTLPRTRRVMPADPRTGIQREWPACRDGTRRSR